jgi:two-component system response regulator FixJ
MTTDEKAAGEIVCLVDDDLAVLKSIGRLLASDGLSVLAFDDPQKFLAHVRGHAVPVVILDVMMQEMSGLDVQAQLTPISPQTRVIIITGRDDPKMRSTATRLGAIAFFTKPFDDNQFLAAVRSALAMQTHA